MFACHNPPAGPGVALSQPLAEAVDALLSVDPDGLTDAELAAAMIDLRRQQSRLAAAVSDLTAAFDARRVWAGDGSRSAADWLAVRAHRPRPDVASEVRVARRLRTMPRARVAWRDGDLSSAHVRALARLAAHPRAGVHFAAAEADLVADARTLRFDDFERVTRYWLHGADPEGPEQQRRRDHDLRRFSLPVGLDGVGHPDGYLTPLAVATVGGALERIERELFEADRVEARARLGDAATAADLARTAAQRRHDALVEMATRAVTAPPDGKRPSPLITVMVGYEMFAGRVCELAGGTVVAPGEVAELLGRDDTLIERAVFDGHNRITDISSQRSFRGTLRRLLDLRQRRCDHDTCFVPAHRCQGDHIVPWSEGGLTTQANGRLRCGPHNRWAFAQHQADAAPSTAASASATVEAAASAFVPGTAEAAGSEAGAGGATTPGGTAPPRPAGRPPRPCRARVDDLVVVDPEGGPALRITVAGRSRRRSPPL